MPAVEINRPAPDFQLADFNGSNVRLSEFFGKQHVLLVFNRGFVWPYCRRHMAQLRQEYQTFVDRDIAIVVVGPEKADKFRQYWQKEELPFVGLPDPRHTVLDLFGQQVKIFKLGRMPAQCLIDKSGVVRYVHYGNSMADIPANEEILAILDRL